MSHANSRPRWMILRDIEAPAILSMAVITTVIGILIWGISPVHAGFQGFLSELRPWFGAGYGLTVVVLLAALLAHNCRWKGLLVGAAALVASAAVLACSGPAASEAIPALGSMAASVSVAVFKLLKWLD